MDRLHNLVDAEGIEPSPRRSGLRIYSPGRPKPVFASHPLLLPAPKAKGPVLFSIRASWWSRNLSITRATSCHPPGLPAIALPTVPKREGWQMRTGDG